MFRSKSLFMFAFHSFTLIALFILASCSNATGTTTPSIQPTSTSTGSITIPTSAPTDVELTVSAASDLVYAFQELGTLFEKETGTKVAFNFGSTGQLAQQIQIGAPVDIFAAANESYINDLKGHGLIIPGTDALYARGRITLWSKDDAILQPESLQDLKSPEIKRIAIANPAHAPYGIAAREALQTAGLWEDFQPKMILGENVLQTLQYAQSGNVDVSIVALSLALATPGGHWTLVPEDLHNPINQALGVIARTKHESEARAFAAFINGETGRPIMSRYGFVLPGESLPQ